MEIITEGLTHTRDPNRTPWANRRSRYGPNLAARALIRPFIPYFGRLCPGCTVHSLNAPPVPSPWNPQGTESAFREWSDITKAIYLGGTDSGDDLNDFVNGKLWPYLSKFKQSAESPDTIEYKIGEIFGELKNRIQSGYNLREIINRVDELRFQTSAEKHEMSQLYEAKT
jgi:hypothetical protein